MHNYVVYDTTLCTYAPTEDADEDVKDACYDYAEQVLNHIPKQVLLLRLGGLNAKIGGREAGESFIGHHSLHEHSYDNGFRGNELAECLLIQE